jgi:hypothetical protein
MPISKSYSADLDGTSNKDSHSLAKRNFALVRSSSAYLSSNMQLVHGENTGTSWK